MRKFIFVTLLGACLAYPAGASQATFTEQARVDQLITSVVYAN